MANIKAAEKLSPATYGIGNIYRHRRNKPNIIRGKHPGASFSAGNNQHSKLKPVQQILSNILITGESRFK